MAEWRKCNVERMIEIESPVTFFNSVLEYDHYFPGESHDFWEIVCILSGKTGVTADKDVYLLESGNAIVHEPMEFHSIWSEKGTAPEIVILTFYAKKMPKLKGRIFRFTPELSKKLRRMAAEAKDIFTYQDGTIELLSVRCGKEMEASLMLSRFDCVIHEILATQNEGITGHQSQSAKNYGYILSVLEQNVSEKLTVNEIAHLCNMSESNLKKIFFKFAGCGVMHYFNFMKVKKAAELISNGFSVKESANKVGFTDQNYFSTVFKRITGTSPTKYK